MDAKPQLVLVPNADSRVNGGGQPTMSSHIANNSFVKMSTPHDCSDILIKPRFVESGSGPNRKSSAIGSDVRLTAAQQAFILAQCLHLQSRSRSDELSSRLLVVSN